MKIHEIEKGIKIPDVHSKNKFPWPNMKKGDSVCIDAEKGQRVYALKRIVGPSARYYGEKTGKKFKTLKTETGVRVWRTK